MVTETRLPHAAGTDMESGRASVGIGPVCLAASTWGSLVQLQEAVRNARTVSLLARPNRITPPFSRHERSYRPIASMVHGIGVRKNGIVTMKPAYLADAVFRATAATVDPPIRRCVARYATWWRTAARTSTGR